MSAAREEILNKLRRTSHHAPGQDYAAIPRLYRQPGILDSTGRILLLEDRLADYGALVYRCSQAELPQIIRDAAEIRGRRRLLIPKQLLKLDLSVSLECRTDDGLSYAELDSYDGVLTECALAIAATGTLVLRHPSGEGRRALTLIPDYHLCILYEDQIVETVAEGISRMATFGTGPLTTVSGPSATSDIEMTRIKGVHGPRILDVIVVG